MFGGVWQIGRHWMKWHFAELLDSHPQKTVEKFFRDVIISTIDKRGQRRLTSRTRRMLKEPLCKSNGCDGSEERHTSTECLLTYRQDLNDYPQPYKAVIRNLQKKANKSFSVCFNRGEEAGPSGLVIQTCSTISRQKSHTLIVEPWDADSDTSDDVLIHVLEDESAEDRAYLCPDKT